MIQELFSECLRVGEGEWERVLLEKCPDDERVRHEVLQLLRADAENRADAETRREQAVPESISHDVHQVTYDFDSLPKVGNYQLLRKIGYGSSGVVYEARSAHRPQDGSQKPTQRYAVKVLHPWLRSEHAFARFDAEARALKSLDHPHVARFVEAGQDHEFRYLVMEFIDGQCLSARLKNENGDYDVSRIPLEHRIAWFQMICQGVAAAHQQLLLHRDVKPSNVLIDSQGNAVVTDFGLVKFLEPESQQQTDQRLMELTSTGQTPGTLLFMAPEQLDGSGKLGLATDVYGLGATLYFLLTGKPPYQGRTAADLSAAIRSGPPPSMRSFDAEVPKDLQAICFKALSAIPTRRYQTAQALEDDIARYMAGEPIIARRIGSFETAAYWLFRNPIQALLVFGLIASMCIGLGLTSIFWIQAERNYADAEASKADLLQTINEVTGHLKSVESDPRTLPLQREMLISIAQGYDRLAVHSDLSPREENKRGVAWFKLGRVENQIGDQRAKVQAYENAERIFRGQVEGDPLNVEWLFDHFHALTALGRSSEALAAIERVNALEKSENLSFRNAYVNALSDMVSEKLESGRLTEAEQFASRAREIAEAHSRRFPEDPSLLRKLAQQHYLAYQIELHKRNLLPMLESLEKATVLIEHAQANEPQDAGIRIEVILYRLRKAELQSLQGNHDEAERDFKFINAASNRFLADFPTYTDAWHYRAEALNWQVRHFWCSGNESEMMRAREQYEQLLDERLREKPICYRANSRLALLIANPCLQDEPDLERANQLLELAQQDPMAPSLARARDTLRLWNGTLNVPESRPPYSIIFEHYISAFDNQNSEPLARLPRVPAAVPTELIFDFVTFAATLYPEGFRRDIAFAKARKQQ